MLIARSIALATLAGLVVSAGGCFSAWEQARFTRDVRLTFPIPENAGLHAQTRNGAISLAESVGAEVDVSARIRATSQERADAVEIVAVEEAGWLVVSARWPEARKGSEGVSFEIAAPGGRPVRATTGNGAVSLTGFAGGATLETSNGSVAVEDHDGPLDLETSNGRITVLNATGTVRADTSNGSVRVELADSNPGPVNIDTSNGSVTLVVGPSFAGSIDADTSNGSVRVGDGAASITGGKTHKVVRFDDGDSVSRIDTSNGSVTIETRG